MNEEIGLNLLQVQYELSRLRVDLEVPHVWLTVLLRKKSLHGVGIHRGTKPIALRLLSDRTQVVILLRHMWPKEVVLLIWCLILIWLPIVLVSFDRAANFFPWQRFVMNLYDTRLEVHLGPARILMSLVYQPLRRVKLFMSALVAVVVNIG